MKWRKNYGSSCEYYAQDIVASALAIRSKTQSTNITLGLGQFDLPNASNRQYYRGGPVKKNKEMDKKLTPAQIERRRKNNREWARPSVMKTLPTLNARGRHEEWQHSELPRVFTTISDINGGILLIPFCLLRHYRFASDP